MRTVTRRTFLVAGATAAAAATALAAGCASAPDGSQDASEPTEGFDVLGSYLPLGSIVTLRGAEEMDLKFMVVSRRPNVTTIGGDGGTRSDLGYVYDYAGVQWPLGFVTDLTLQAQGAECLGFNREDISRIDFVGFEGGREQEARTLLDEAYGSMETCASVLLPMQQDIVSTFPVQDDEDAL